LLGVVYLIGVKLLSELMSFLEYAKNNFHYVSDYFYNATFDFEGLFETLPEEQAANLTEMVQSGIGGLMNAAQSLLSNLSSHAFNFATAIPELFIFFLFFIVAVFLFNISLDKMKHGFLSIFED